MIRLAIGCVVEPTPKLLNQAILLLQSLRQFGGVLSQCDVYVCTTGVIPNSYLSELISYHPRIVTVQPFSSHPHSNKLRFPEHILNEHPEYTHIMFMDCDTVVVRDFSSWIDKCEEMLAKLTDVVGVPTQIRKKVFKLLGAPYPEETVLSDIDRVPMSPYYNAGILIWTRECLEKLMPIWADLVYGIVGENLLGNWSMFTDQIALAAAVEMTKTNVEYLPTSMNFPSHLDVELFQPDSQAIDPFIIHHHDNLDDHNRIIDHPFPHVSKRIKALNELIDQRYRNTFNQARFWDQRYTNHAGLGSGVDSHGQAARLKRGIVTKYLDFLETPIETVLDIGCGDTRYLAGLNLPDYTGIDISEVVIARNREKELKSHQRSFLCGDFTELALPKADMVLCFDVLIHYDSFADYLQAVRRMVVLTRRFGLISGYSSTRVWNSGIVFYYGPLEKTLEDVGATTICKIGTYGNVDIFFYRSASVDSKIK